VSKRTEGNEISFCQSGFKNDSMFQDPSINILTRDVPRLEKFYERLGFSETFRTPKEGAPVHVEVTLDSFTVGISSVDAAIKDHGLNPNLGGRPVAIVLWTDDVDREYARIIAEGASSLSPPHDFLAANLRAAWIADPDGNPITFTQRRKGAATATMT
jgi:predicted enzyme related to lactoylglutathione lyase